MNNGKVRIYELSRELDLDNKDVLTICERLAIPVKSHSSTVTESDAEKIRSTAAGAPKRSLQKPILKPKQKPTLAQPKTTRPIRKPQILEVKRPKSPSQNPVYARPQRPSASKAEAPPQDVPPLPEPPLYAESQTVESILPRHIPCIGRGYIEPALDLIPDVLPLRMVLIPSGTFTMGSPNDEPERYDREDPQRNVTVPPFFMGRYPITQAQWRAVAALDQVERPLQEAPSKFKGNNHPVENISWHDAVEFCHRLKQITDRPYRLPTEAEWEYACRAGTTTPFHYGKTLTDEIANYQATSTYADGPKGEYRQQTTPVDYFGIANAFGLSDMHGNVLEWCQDQYHDSYKGAPIDGSAWEDREEGASRILRGGSWGYGPRYCRSAYRNDSYPVDRFDLIGFRVVCSAPRILP